MELIPVNVDPRGRPVSLVCNPKAQKNYSCDKCGVEIKKGQRYVRGCRGVKIRGRGNYTRFCESCYWTGREDEREE